MNGRSTTWERLRRVDGRVWDGLLTAAVLAFAQMDLWLSPDTGPGAREPDLLAAAILVVACAPLYWRRRRPLETAILVAAATIAFGALQHPATEPILPLVVASYSAAAHRPRSVRQLLTIAAAVAASGVIQADSNPNWVEIASGAFFTIGVPAATGRIAWNRRQRVERDRDLTARDAVALERSRIARELHDIVAHTMSVMVVQAGGARAVLRRDPDDAERALRSIEESGRSGLAEMRRLLAADGDAPLALAPQSGIGQLDELLGRMRATGLAVELVIEGDARSLPAGVDLSAYRIVQEALTNTLKHAGESAHARVLLRYDEDAIEVDVTDNGRGPSSTGDGDGRGLIGMRERVAFLNGDIRAGARPGGGFVVRARIPVADWGAPRP